MNLGQFWWLVPACLGCGLAGGVLGAWLFSRRARPGQEVQAPAPEPTAAELTALRLDVDRLARQIEAGSRYLPPRAAPAPTPMPIVSVATPTPETGRREAEFPVLDCGHHGAPVANPQVARTPAAPSPAPAKAAVPGPVLGPEPAPDLPAELAAQALQALTDEEIDALPADLPRPAKPRKRVMAAPRKRTYDPL